MSPAIFTSPTAVRLLMRYGGSRRAAARPVPPRADRLRGRGPQRAGLGVAPEGRSSRTASRSSTTCGRPRPAGRSSATRTASSCCRSSQAPRACRCRGSRPRSSTSTARSCRSAEKGIMVIRRPFPGLTPTLWGEPERYGADYWVADPGLVLGRRRRPHRRGRLRVVRRPRRRDHQDRRAPPRHDRGRDRVPAPSGRRRGRRDRAARTSCAAR